MKGEGWTMIQFKMMRSWEWMNDARTDHDSEFLRMKNCWEIRNKIKWKVDSCQSWGKKYQDLISVIFCLSTIDNFPLSLLSCQEKWQRKVLLLLDEDERRKENESDVMLWIRVLVLSLFFSYQWIEGRKERERDREFTQSAIEPLLFFTTNSQPLRELKVLFKEIS